MRKIDADASRAFNHAETFQRHNTAVTVEQAHGGEQTHVTMILHGHPIARRIVAGNDDKLFITSAGYETPTTKGRLNSIPGVQVSQKNGDWYLNGRLWEDTEEWVEVL